jgi:hypothetical protein
MLNWFNDAEHPENAAKEIFLKEVFEVAGAEERYNNGEIGTSAPRCTIRIKSIPRVEGGATSIPDMHSDRNRYDDSDIVHSDDVLLENDKGLQVIHKPESLGFLTPMVQYQPQADFNEPYQRPTASVSHYY